MDSVIIVVFGIGLLFLAIKGIAGLLKDANKIRSSSYERPANERPLNDTPKPIVEAEEKTTEESSLAKWRSSLQLVSKGMGETIEFTYESRDGERSRRIIDLHAILQAANERMYFSGYCHTEKEDRTFNIDSITTMIKHKSKRYEVYEYLEDKYGLEVY